MPPVGTNGKNNIKSLYNNSTEKHLDELFANWEN